MESLMFDHQLQQNAVPSRMPIRNSYVTSGFGTRADPFAAVPPPTRAWTSTPRSVTR
jgi:hypothetical protein